MTYGGSGADVGGLRDRNDLSHDGAFTVSERAVGDSRSTAVDGDNVGRVDGRGSDTTSGDGGLAIAGGTIASSVAVSVGDALSELGALLGVGSLDVAVESASASIGVECGTGISIRLKFLHKMWWKTTYPTQVLVASQRFMQSSRLEGTARLVRLAWMSIMTPK